MSNQDSGGFNELAACRGGLMLYNRNDIYIGASLRKYGEFSGQETALFRMIVQPGRTVLDVGANIGVHTVDLSRLVGSAGAVHAVEPQRLIFQALCANVALNSCTNVFTRQAAVGAAPNAILVPSLDPDQRNNYGGLSLLEPQPGESVQLITIDNLRLPDCQFIKLDVEGTVFSIVRFGCLSLVVVIMVSAIYGLTEKWIKHGNCVSNHVAARSENNICCVLACRGFRCSCHRHRDSH